MDKRAFRAASPWSINSCTPSDSTCSARTAAEKKKKKPRQESRNCILEAQESLGHFGAALRRQTRQGWRRRTSANWFLNTTARRTKCNHWPRISSYCSPVRLHKSWPPRSRIVKSLAVAATTTPNSLPQAKMASMTRSASSAGLCWLSGSNTRPIVRLHKRRRHIVVFLRRQVQTPKLCG